MTKKPVGIDKTRASREGHEYHETWTARKALQLLWPGSELTAIAIEGLSPTDQARASAVAVEIADITLYFGGAANFKDATGTTVAQFKYSIAKKDRDFRAADAKKTVEKFAKTYQDFILRFGASAVEDKLDFQLITNQPVNKALLEAISALACNAPMSRTVADQAKQIQDASGLVGEPLAAFARKLKLLGCTGSLPETKNELASLVVDWSATGDPIAAARLGNLRELVREKAGYAGTGRNLIMRTDILAALQIADPNDLLPCEPRLADVGTIVEREQLNDALVRIVNITAPLFIQATGGIGKTVFMDSLATKLARDHEVVFFDCFGGGAYRSPEDSRHLPKKGLLHIANTLAFRGLCDPMLPDNPDMQGLLRTFRRRLHQCLDTLTRLTPGRTMVLMIDAIDNADMVARQRSEDCFPVNLMESLDTEPIPGVNLVISCRPERQPPTYAKYEIFELHPFTKRETESFLRERVPAISQAEINIAQARSGGNPRVLDYLLKAGHGVLDRSELHKKIELDDLIQKRIIDALGIALERGYQEKDLEAFLAGLAVLPPPVPVDEYAGAQGISLDAIESFASDMYPLLERTNQGLMFRDEPTETLINKKYASSTEALRRVASNLLSRQEISVYAARALPGLLHQLGDGEQLFALAFDERIPSAITSTVGKRNIRYARLKAATLHAALHKDYNKLVQLLLELSTVAAVDQRGCDYILNHPDLVVAARDADATRRLFETRTGWPGTRHARLAIANTLYCESEEANRHVSAASEWIEHYIRTSPENGRPEQGPECADIAAIPFFLISQGRGEDAARFLLRWRDWYAYNVSEVVLRYTAQLQSSRPELPFRYDSFVGAISSIGGISAALSYQEFTDAERKNLVCKLARRCKTTTKIDLPDHYHRDRSFQIKDGLCKSAAIALSLELQEEALTIALRVQQKRPSLWAFRDVFYNRDIFPFLFGIALRAAAKKRSIHEKDLLPQELTVICSRIGKHITGEKFSQKAKDLVSKHVRKVPPKEDEDTAHALSYEGRQNAERFLDKRLALLLSLTKAFSAVLCAPLDGASEAFQNLIETWEYTSRNGDAQRPAGEFEHFFRLLGFDVAFFVFWARCDLKSADVERFLTAVHNQNVGAHDLVRIVAILARRKPLCAVAGEQAIKARALIEKEDEVTYRASLFGALGRAILPASNDEASAYFHGGLEQMDAIGSGDYEFTNELLLFASEMKGDELYERDFHTLSNICELNIGEEPEKFYWGAYGRGLSKAAGLRGLAKLSRWDDRAKIALRNTLLPYLTALLEDGKIDPKDALAINRLANPVEYYFASTREFAQALRQKAGPDPIIIGELIQQFQDDNPGYQSDYTIKILVDLAQEALGPTSEVSEQLAAAEKCYGQVRNTQNERMNHGNDDVKMQKAAVMRDRKNRMALQRIAAATDPICEASLTKAICDFNSLGNMYDLKGAFFADLRNKVSYGSRARYISNIACLENLFFYWKFHELKEAREAWSGSSASLAEAYKRLASPLIIAHADDLIEHGRLSGSSIKEISDFTGVAMTDLIIELIKVFARPDRIISGSVWLAFAAFICSEAKEGQGQLALQRLLSSEAARLADNVADGPWTVGLYPPNDFEEVAAGLIWRTLGSPYAADRWRAAHSLRRFAAFARWEIIDSVIGKIGSVNAGPFQARELPFFYLHARLWLLIALARLARDFPAEIGRYKVELLSFVLEEKTPHVLMRHFAARALIACMEAGRLKLSAKQAMQVRNADLSPHRRLKKRIRRNGDFYSGRPRNIPEPAFRFHLDYDFHKLDVDNLAEVFDQPCWKVADLMSEIVHALDPTVGAMYDSPGRSSHHSYIGLTTKHHTHGQQLGWHALFLAAGRLLIDFPVTDDRWYEGDPWGEWLRRYCLTRNDGLWLSDGTDRTPLDTAVFLLERTEKDLVITGDRHKILSLAGLENGVGQEIIVRGHWYSADNVRVSISSALVSAQTGGSLAQKLTREEPMMVWLPTLDEREGNLDHIRDGMKQYSPWIVCASGEVRLDEHDPHGVSVANCRPHLSQDYTSYYFLTKKDAFGRIWTDQRGDVVLSAQAWGRDEQGREDGPHPGTRLSCTSKLLEKILTERDLDLLILIKLERYEKESYRRDSRWTHTIGVARVTKALSLQYFKGQVNFLHRPRF